MRGHYIYGGKAEKHKKKWRKTGKWEKILRKTGKKKCAGNRKMTFLSHGKLENLKIFAKNGKLFFKPAETGKHFCKAAENWKTPKRQWKVAESRKTGKKATEKLKILNFPWKVGNGPPITPPSYMNFQ